ncbi:hypothetical protein DL96DRAFT_1509166 [Flagelloscypha sp. PMI_526]|nr:hypothetical protein DL96DRAFT_1509166 [Flagelloscypha sp. PMI_526]
MLEELSNMDRITQLQDEIQRLLTIMSSTITYLTTRTTFLQINAEIPVTKQRNPDKFDTADVFEDNSKELVADLLAKAKQIETLINSLPIPEQEEEQDQRLQNLEDEMSVANEEYIQAVERARKLHSTISDVLTGLLKDTILQNEVMDS